VRVDEFDYDLPEALIAQTPLTQRSSSRLLVVEPHTKSLRHRHFGDILESVQPGDVIVLNDSRVIPARLFGVKVETGAKIEILLTKQVGLTTWIALAKPAKRLRVGSVIQFFSPPSVTAEVQTLMAEAEVTETVDDGLRRLEFTLFGITMQAFLEEAGIMPLPPYIHQQLADKQRYQTVYANPSGSVAAPTAGLHFTPELLEALRQKGVEVLFVTLHVGLGTFRPMQVDKVEDHTMHTEWYEVGLDVAARLNAAKSAGKRIIAVGTTALRTLESACKEGVISAGTAETDIFIYPGYRFQMVDALITNFHLPKSTLIMLISAFLGGGTFWREVYGEAVAQSYRFFSFGDAMFITQRGVVN